VEVTPLPGAPETVLGVINVQGEVIPVINLRRRFGLPERELELTDQFVIARTSSRTVALVVDAVSSVIQRVEAETVAAEKILPHLRQVEGVIKFDDTLVLIHNLDTLLSLRDEAALRDVIDTEQ
jgi:purine-binding chemotaxis protein CheW